MIISFGPVAREVEIDLEVGLPPLAVTVDTLTLKYCSEGIITCQLSSTAPNIESHPVKSEPMKMVLNVPGLNRWGYGLNSQRTPRPNSEQELAVLRLLRA